MKTSSKIFSVLFLGALIVLAYFAFPIIKQRYFTDEPVTPVKINISTDDSTATENTNPNDQASPEISDDTEQTDGSIPVEQIDVFKTITKQDCLNECSAFKSTSDKEYCLQVCSSSSSTENNTQCSEKSGLQKDYCHKTLGITNKDFEECKKITDKNIQESCINTVTDKILERSDSTEDRNP
ncbi:MAG: hypothetical protein Q7T51_04270 [Candidatus Moranbacteria bacterium]|nr:hypothetical protein [Candidatus Moranbacteria bacterium]